MKLYLNNMGKYPVDKRIGTVYKIENKLNGKIYIGQTIMDVRDRWYRHCEINRSNPAECNMPIKRAILKYGKENFDFSIIERVPRELLNKREKYWIVFIKQMNLDIMFYLVDKIVANPLNYLQNR